MTDSLDKNTDIKNLPVDDILDRFIFENKDIRACTIRLNKSLLENNIPQNYPLSIQRLLGEFMAACSLLSSNLKFEGRLILQLRSSSEISLLIAECSHMGDLRAYAQYEESFFENDVNIFEFGRFKGSTLAMTIQPDIGEAYQGIVPLEGNNLGECLQGYFEQSEQLQSHFYLHCDLYCGNELAVGFMLQQLPAQIEPKSDVRELHWEEVKSLALTLSNEELLGLAGRELMFRLFHEDGIRFLEESAVQFSCSCSKERMEDALISLGRNELNSVLLEQGQIDMHCEFCKQGYVFGNKEVDELFETGQERKILH